jgi:hypothetical protein
LFNNFNLILDIFVLKYTKYLQSNRIAAMTDVRTRRFSSVIAARWMRISISEQGVRNEEKRVVSQPASREVGATSSPSQTII